MTYAEIQFAKQAPIGVLTLDNPAKLNALSQKMIGEIIDALTRAAGDPELKVIVIRASGKHFCAGHYLKEMVGLGAKAARSIFEQCNRMMALIHAIPQPVIAQVQGVATAAGCQLVAWCDLAVAEAGARFATPGVKIGLFCTTPMVAISRAIGRKAAMEMLLTGRFFSAREARELGLINRVVAQEALAEETEKLALQIADASRLVLEIGKRGFYAQVDQTDEKALDYAGQAIALNLLAEDAQTGITAFLEKRAPAWRDR